MVWTLVLRLLESKQTQHKYHLHKPTLNLRQTKNLRTAYIFFSFYDLQVSCRNVFSGVSSTIHTPADTRTCFSLVTLHFKYFTGMNLYESWSWVSISEALEVDAVFLGVCEWVNVCVLRRGCFQVYRLWMCFKQNYWGILNVDQIDNFSPLWSVPFICTSQVTINYLPWRNVKFLPHTYIVVGFILAVSRSLSPVP